MKIKFYNETNVWSKVKKDLANRTNGKLYGEGGFLYYEDTVYGISKLRSWVYGYGCLAVILERLCVDTPDGQIAVWLFSSYLRTCKVETADY